MDYQTAMLEFSQLKIYMQQWTNFLSSEEPTRLVDDETIMNFQTLLKVETWEPVYIDTDPNHV
jgi:hypothetical protein